jgi:hypothetical protein
MQNLSSPLLVIGETMIQPGQRQRLDLPVARLSTQTMLSLPITVIRGREPGPHIWLSAAVHGDEINGVEIIRRVLTQLQPKQLRGMVIAVPIVNIFGFIEQSRYLPDRRDLNRCFPGSPKGSLAARLASLFMKEIVSHCQYGIDLHTASHHRTNLPQIRGNLQDMETLRCAKAFGAPVMLHSVSRDGSLRQAAAKRGICVLLYEGGEALRFDEEAIQIGERGILRVLAALGMTSTGEPPDIPSLQVSKTRWIRAPKSGILVKAVELGTLVQHHQHLGWVGDPFGEERKPIRSTCTGMVIGCTQNPLVSQGDALFHVAVVS